MRTASPLLVATVALLLTLGGRAALAEPACREGLQFDHALAYTQGEVAGGRSTGLIVLRTQAEVDGLIDRLNERVGSVIAPGLADHAIAFLRNGRFWLFGYRDGCQIGYVAFTPHSEGT